MGIVLQNQEIIRTHFIQPSNHWDNPKQSQRTHHQETSEGDFFPYHFFVSPSPPPQKTPKKPQKTTTHILPPPEKNNRSSKQKKHQHQQPSHQVIQAMTFPLEVTNTKRAQKNCQAQRIARWFGFRLNPRMKGIVNLGVALKSQTTNRPQTDNHPP